MKFFNKLFGRTTDPEIKQPEVVKEKKPRKLREKKPKPEPVAEKTVTEPSVKVVNFEFDKNNPRLGSIELDWNTEFITLLRGHGYTGQSDEELVDAWLNDVCKTIYTGSLPENNITNLDGTRYVIRTDLGDGRSEVR